MKILEVQLQTHLDTEIIVLPQIHLVEQQFEVFWIYYLHLHIPPPDTASKQFSPGDLLAECVGFIGVARNRANAEEEQNKRRRWGR